MEKDEIIIFESEDIKLEVSLNNETVWLSAKQMAQLFKRNFKTIRKHINSALKEECKDTTVSKLATLQSEGRRTVTRTIDYYNLDVILSVGYRVKSENGIKFRKWANKVLKEYLLKGYAINQKRLDYLEKAVKLIDIATRANNGITNNDSKEVLKVINTYTKALNLLDDYDHHNLKKIDGKTSDEIITYDECMAIINELRFNEESNLFGLERNKGLISIINDIYQTFDGKDIYPSIEEKAANFLYMVIKNHVFIDGNKRIAATLFIYFLFFYDILYKEDKQIIDNKALAALTLLIASSNPKEKDIIIDLITNFLTT